MELGNISKICILTSDTKGVNIYDNNYYTQYIILMSVDISSLKQKSIFLTAP